MNGSCILLLHISLKFSCINNVGTIQLVSNFLFLSHNFYFLSILQELQRSGLRRQRVSYRL